MPISYPRMPHKLFGGISAFDVIQQNFFNWTGKYQLSNGTGFVDPRLKITFPNLGKKVSLKYYKHTNNHALCRTIFEGAILTIIHFVFIYSIKVF